MGLYRADILLTQYGTVDTARADGHLNPWIMSTAKYSFTHLWSNFSVCLIRNETKFNMYYVLIKKKKKSVHCVYLVR